MSSAQTFEKSPSAPCPTSPQWEREAHGVESRGPLASASWSPVLVFFHDTNLPFSVPSRSRGGGEGPGGGWSQLRPGTPNLIVNVQRGSPGAPGFLMGEVGGGAGAQWGPRRRRQRPLLSGGGRSCTGTPSSVGHLVWPQERSVGMRVRVRLGMQEGSTGGLRRSVGPSRFHARFHLGFPQSSEVGMSSHSLAASPAHSPKNEPIVCSLRGPSCKGPGGQWVHLLPPRRSQQGPRRVGRPSHTGPWD